MEFGDTIYRQGAIYALDEIESEVADGYGFQYEKWRKYFTDLPSAQLEITDEQAIEHLQESGWMQNHDKQMYEMGLKEQLADDSGSYDSLIPNKDCISRQAAIDVAREELESGTYFDIPSKIEALPSAPERKTGKWIYITDGHYEYFKCDQCEKHSGEPTPFCRYCGADMREGQDGER